MSPPRWLRRACAAAAIALLPQAVLTLPMAMADELRLLEIVINGYPTGKIGEFVMRDGALFARLDQLRDLGLRLPPETPADAQGLVPLAGTPGLDTRMEASTQTLYVTATDERLVPALLLPAHQPQPPAGTVQSATGATLNYDLAGSTSGGPSGSQSLATGLFDLRGFSPWGVISTGLLARAGGTTGNNGAFQALRLDSAYVYSDPDSLRRYRLGDFVGGGTAWTRPVRLGGVQINSDFSMRPDLTTFPVPSVLGSAAVPSTVDVMVNSTRLFSSQVTAGPFQVPTLPVITGAGTVAMTLTDALGHQVTSRLPFYASSNLLSAGLQAYSAEVGAVRRDWGLQSNNYGRLTGSATYRRGLSNAVTVEGHVEGAGGLAMGGIGAAVNVADFGVLTLSAAGSAGNGAQFSAGFQRMGEDISFNASITRANQGYRDIAALTGDGVAHQQINAGLSFALGPYGSLALSYTGLDRDASATPLTFYARDTLLSGTTVSVSPATHAHVLSGSYSAQVGSLTLAATGFHDFATGRSTGLLLTLTLPLGSRSSASASLGGGSSGLYGQLQANQSANETGDYGYQAYAAGGQQTHAFADLQYRAPWALLSGGMDHSGEETAGRAEIQGALSLLDGALFASTPINDSFAVVDADGTAGLHVLGENRPVGVTDGGGRLLVPDLRSFDANQLAIDPTDLPIDMDAATTAQTVRPQDRSGVVVRFPLRRAHGALLRLVDEDGQPLPMGSEAILDATGARTPVGYDGLAYVLDLSARNRLTVTLPNRRRCMAEFDYQDRPDDIPTLGPLLCRKEVP
ncbi:fimbria/pilus outer membrane usher protein [Nitrospirillum bahiense]|uniref:Outer membrane usher protein n=1 Tax=Nitrospirillum amazonense TaxID=28077 RepID=A0A560GAF6_9PROT|nr:fimbria/pilus outer membrane usher protein [Nitrospirillum amazonense]TWB30754.1 outer membrane usher protein [Nitrospirillum amazonense]